MDIDVMHKQLADLKRLVEDDHHVTLEEVKGRFNKMKPVFDEVEDRLKLGEEAMQLGLALDARVKVMEAQLASLIDMNKSDASPDKDKPKGRARVDDDEDDKKKKAE